MSFSSFFFAFLYFEKVCFFSLICSLHSTKTRSPFLSSILIFEIENHLFDSEVCFLLIKCLFLFFFHMISSQKRTNQIKLIVLFFFCLYLSLSSFSIFFITLFWFIFFPKISMVTNLKKCKQRHFNSRCFFLLLLHFIKLSIKAKQYYYSISAI